MTLIEKLQQIERVDGLIRRKSTGPPSSLASRLGKSERYIYNLINLMKTMGAPIYFCYASNSYCYEQEVIFSMGFSPKSRQVVGGKAPLVLAMQQSMDHRLGGM